MNRSSTPQLIKRLRAAFGISLAAGLPLVASAESVVFDANFPGGGNTFSVTPSVITSHGTTWYGATSKTSGAFTNNGANGMTISYSGTTGPLEIAGRFAPTAAAMNISQTGDYIQAQGSFYTTGLSQVVVGLYNSGGVDPLVTAPNATEMVKGGLSSTTGATGGTLGWLGYRALAGNASTSADIKTRPAQTTSPTYIAYDLIGCSSSPYNAPAGTSIGSVPASSSSVTWDLTGVTQYNFIYRIERKNATTFTISYTIKNSDNTSTLYSVSGDTTATAAQPGNLTSTFDAIALGVRGASGPAFQVTSLSITGKNSDIARITVQPVAQNIANGGSGSLSVTGAGTGTLSYQWYKDGSPIPSATSATYPISNASGADVGSYSVVVTNAYGSETSASVAVNVSSVSAPSFTTQPTNQTVDAGTTLTLTSLASGVPTPTYQWYKGTDPIPGATSATYSVSSTAASDAGSYKVVATNSQGSATSNIVTVTVNTAAPAITTPPAPVTVNVGSTINLSVSATGLPAPTYQWYKGTDPIPGATASSYSVASATTANAGSYTVTVTNPYGSVTSDPVTVTVNVIPPSVTTQPPASLTVYYGKRITLNAAYAGSGPLTYQWYKGTDPISGATSSSYTIASAAVADAGNYHVVVTNEASSATSNTTALSVVFPNETPVFATNFAGNTLNNASTTITSSVTSWYILAARLATASFVGDDSTTADVVEARPLTLTWNTTSSSSLVETAARFSSTPVSLTTTGDFLRFRATFSATNLRVLAFGLFNSGGVSPIALDGSNTDTLASGSTASHTGTENWVGYRSALTAGNTSGDIGTRPAQTQSTTNKGNELLMPTGSTSSAFSEPAGVAVGITPAVGASIAFANNTVYTLEYTIVRSASNQNTISYSLYSGASATGTPLYTTNATTTTAEALPSAVTSSFDSLAIGLRNVDGTTVPTLAITDLSVVRGSGVTGVAPSITGQPTGQTLSVGATLTLTASASGTPAPTFQWYKDNQPIPTGTSATFTIPSVVSGDSGSYKVVATNGVGSATSNTVTVTVGSSSPYQTWSSSQGLTAGVNDGATQDPDNDGVNNLIEFALGGNPLSTTSAPVPLLARSGGNVTFTYDVQVAATAQYQVGAEYTSDLSSTWTTAVNGTGGVTITTTPVNANTDHVVVTVPASSPRIFVRLRVQPLP